MKSNIILNIPHSSKEIPPEYLGSYFNVQELNETLVKLTDTFTDELFSYDGIKKIVFPYSRAFCDVERFVENEPMEEKYGQGFYYTNGVNLKPFRSDNNKEEIRTKYYEHHHSLLKEMVQSLDNPLIIDCHSFPNEIFPCIPFSDNNLPDFILGHNGKEREIEICSLVYELLEELGFKVNINHPYSGSLTVDDCSSIMIEVNRRLYLSNNYLYKKTDFYKIENIIKIILKKIDVI